MHDQPATHPILLAACSLVLILIAPTGMVEAQTSPASLPQHSASGQTQPATALPPTPQTGASSGASSSAQPDATHPGAVSDPAPLPTTRAEVRWSQGQLAVSADNSSLNEILRDIAQHTGMKISGGLADERVFGIYGPAPASEVLAQLLDGASSNVLLVQDPGSGVRELVLTPRTGAASPPNPNAHVEEPPAVNDLPPLPSREEPTRPRRTQNFGRGESGNTASPPVNGLTTQQSPNGVRTPQQVYDQNLQNQQQGQQPTQTPQPGQPPQP